MSFESPQNIVLCADGTGQTGSKARGTNVWKVREAVAQRDHESDAGVARQIVYYVEGVGAGPWTVEKVLGNAFGYGLSEDIRELYTSLARAYREGDRIYLFGFSRGAFAVRSLAGMISEVGVIDGLGVIDGQRGSAGLEQLVRSAYKAYRARRTRKAIGRFKDECERDGIAIYDARIHFVGVWDTVAAYGAPFFAPLVRRLRRPLNDQVTDKIERAYHALALDDNRQTFSPTLYDEAGDHGAEIEQVWFAGAHANVGGGYPTQGLSALALDWIMYKARMCGLRFTEESLAEVNRDIDETSLLYDQRLGLGAIWRYLPRNVEKLSQEANTTPKVHVSVMRRIELATANYAPITLPARFKVVATRDDDYRADRANRLVEETAAVREKHAKPAWVQIKVRKRAHAAVMRILTMVALGLAFIALAPAIPVVRTAEEAIPFEGYVEGVALVLLVVLVLWFLFMARANKRLLAAMRHHGLDIWHHVFAEHRGGG